MKPKDTWPIEVFKRAHRDYPNAVGEFELFCVAFFGHNRPANLLHKRTPKSVWRGLCRKHLNTYISEVRMDTKELLRQRDALLQGVRTMLRVYDNCTLYDSDGAPFVYINDVEVKQVFDAMRGIIAECHVWSDKKN
jgi:hypothetical protein